MDDYDPHKHTVKTRRPKKYPAHVRIATTKTPKHEVTVRNGDERIHCLDFVNVTELHFYERDREAYKHTYSPSENMEETHIPKPKGKGVARITVKGTDKNEQYNIARETIDGTVYYLFTTGNAVLLEYV